mgnify:CR=1 FL=1
MEFSCHHGALLQSRVGLAHSQGSRGGAIHSPNLDVALQIGAAKLEAGESSTVFISLVAVTIRAPR